MSFTRFAITLAIAGSVLTPATATAQRSSPGYTYRLTITGRTTEPTGRSTEYVVMAGHALATEKAGRLDVDQAAWKRGAVADRGDYILYDSTSMTIVAPAARQVVRLARANLEHELSASAPSAIVSDVAVTFEKLGPDEPTLGLSTTRYRITQSYTLSANGASGKRSTTEHVVHEIWTTDEKPGLADPFARLALLPFRAGSPGGADDLSRRTTEALSRMGAGAPLKIVTTSTSTSNRNVATQTVTTMTLTDLEAESIDDDILTPPTDFQVVALGALARSAASAQSARAGEPTKVSRPAATDNAAAEAKAGFVKGLHSMGRPP